VLFVYAAVVLARMGRFAALWSAAAVVTVGILVLAVSPVGQTVALRLETPHSNERRSTVADVVVQTTWEGSPLVGYGTNRQVIGSFSSLAGGGSPDCHNCAAPPLGTQGFAWRLVLTTGFVGTALFALFILIQLLAHIRRRDPVIVLGCMALVVSCVFSLVYDSLESPLFMVMLAVGLMNRRRLAEDASTLLAETPRGAG
jgi:hypothetical protein